jgi:hypothetical protein
LNQVIEKLLIELDKPMNGDPWYGSSIKKVLEEITHEEAFAITFVSAHSIAEIALHVCAWINEVNSRLEGNEPADPKMGDWPKVERYGQSYWTEIKSNIYSAHESLIELVTNFPFEKFEERMGKERIPELGTGFSFREMLIGLMQHNVYHLGQIALLKKIV